MAASTYCALHQNVYTWSPSVYALLHRFELSCSCIVCKRMTASPGDQIFAPDDVVEFLFLAVGTDSVPVDGVQNEAKVNGVEEPRADGISGKECNYTDYTHNDCNLPHWRGELCHRLYKRTSTHQGPKKLAICVIMIDVI
jgi:hypothetical protein